MKQSPIRIDFKLSPLTELRQWMETRDPGDLHWSGLTEGCYSIKVGEHRMFEYTEDALSSYGTPKSTPESAWVDYRVVRLYEDILDILPDATRSIPMKIHQMIQSPAEMRRWRKHCDAWLIEHFEEDAAEYVRHSLSLHWLEWCTLGTSHLVSAPRIRFWRFVDKIHISWESPGKTNDGFPMWTAKQGEFQVSLSEFEDAIGSFHVRLLDETAERISELEALDPLPNGKIDASRLYTEHEFIKGSLARAQASSPHEIDWDLVFKVMSGAI